MIYLFNSACKPSYFANVYRLVGKPAGLRQEMRYKDGQNTPPVATDREYLGSECTICYVDRYAEGGYRFYPFRRGRIRRISRTQGHVYYDVELGQHCHAPSPEDFTAGLYESAETCPRLVDSDPESSNDGVYCVKGPAFDDKVQCTNDSWVRAVDQIHGTFAFRFGAPAFFLTEVLRKGKTPHADELGFRLKADAEYEVIVTYRFATEREIRSQRIILIRLGSDINHEYPIDSRSDRIRIPVKVPRTERTTASLNVTTLVATEGSSGGNLAYTIDIPYRTQSRRLHFLLFPVIFAAIYCKNAWRANWPLEDPEVWLLSAAEFVPFAIILWALLRLRRPVA